MAHFKPYDKDFRAQRRIQGEDVYGNKIQTLNHSAVRSFSGQKLKNIENSASKTNNYQFPQSYNQQDAGTYSHFSRDRKHNETSDSCMFRPIRGNGTPMDVGYEQNWRKRRTPHETSMQIGSGRVHKTSASSEFSDEMHFQPIESNNSTKANQAVDLVVTNLDQAIDNKELRRLLTNMLKEHVMIISLNISMQQDGTPIANIRVSSQQEAQFAISQLHRQKLGNKRIMIACSQNNLPDPAQLRIMVINLLQEVPDNCMPLFRFIDLLESRYHCFVSVSEIKKLKDVCSITDDYGSRIISLTNEVKSSPPPNLSRTYLPYCATHCTNQQTRGWCEIKSMQTPCILMSLQLFSKKLIEMLNSHLGFMPLLSFQTCYELEYHEQLPVNENGVPLEHLISCVSNVEIICVGPNKNIKVITQKVKFAEASSEVAAPVKSAQSSPLTPNINLLCRELVDLLKTTDKCQLLLTKFIPAYHHHFGRQCRVADYGYTKLLDLFESIPHVIQIMGDSARKVITLSHNAQLRRFTSDLLRILKVQPMKQILLCDFSAAYEKVMGKSFNAVEYGLCMFEDLLQDLPENTIVITQNTDSGYLIAIPKREQTPEEVLRTKQFAAEVIDLLKHSPYYTMVFNKFVPAYHHHFGHQCKVSDYGFTKLIELFEALPDVVKIQDLDNGERIVSLTQVQGMQILGTQINQMIKNAKLSSILLDDLPSLFLRECGYPLKPDMYECDSVVDLVDRIADYIEVIHSNSGTLLVGLDMDSLSTLLIRCWTLLLKAPHSKDLATFKYEYQSKYNSTFSLNNLQQLEQVVTLTTRADLTCISLTPLYKVAAQLYHVLYKNNGSILYEHLEKFYYDYYGMPLKLANYNIHSVDEFYNQFNLLFFVRGKKKSIVVLKRNLSEHSVLLPPSLFNSSQASVNNAQSWPALANLQESNSASAKVMKVSPPKPDTPPTPSYSLPWSSHWLLSSDNDASFSINMPIVHNPKLLGDPQNLISPAKGLVPSPWSSIPTILAPHPTELPMPDKLMSKGVMADDSTDSGVNTKLDTTHSDNEVDLSSFEKFAGANFLSFNN